MSGPLPSQGAIAALAEARLDALAHEVLGEKAASLGRAGAVAERSVARLNAHAGGAEERRALVREAADAVYAYFIQRELCGFRRHDAIIREFAIPGEVLARLGAK